MSGCYYYDERGNRCECYPSETADKLLAAMERNAKLEELVKAILAYHRFDPFTSQELIAKIDLWDSICASMEELGIEVDG